MKLSMKLNLKTKDKVVHHHRYVDEILNRTFRNEEEMTITKIRTREK